ncbi:MAG: nicotinate (nicotinamide) nucleotide adenylyltransferase, partial [Bdellovibrionota bacterium]
MRRGIFGGSFNPPHMGHLKSLEAIIKKTGLDAIHVIPSHQNPGKLKTEGPTPEQRMKMVELCLQGFSPKFILDDREIRRGGKSYTIDTVNELKKEYPKDELILIVGLDQFEAFHSWKDYPQILESASL